MLSQILSNISQIMQRFIWNIVIIMKGGANPMFEKEIMSKSKVELYDNQLNLLKSGVITSFNYKPGYIVIDYCIFYPIHLIAKIKVQSQDHIQPRKLAHL